MKQITIQSFCLIQIIQSTNKTYFKSLVNQKSNQNANQNNEEPQLVKADKNEEKSSQISQFPVADNLYCAFLISFTFSDMTNKFFLTCFIMFIMLAVAIGYILYSSIHFLLEFNAKIIEQYTENYQYKLIPVVKLGNGLCVQYEHPQDDPNIFYSSGKTKEDLTKKVLEDLGDEQTLKENMRLCQSIMKTPKFDFIVQGISTTVIIQIVQIKIVTLVTEAVNQINLGVQYSGAVGSVFLGIQLLCLAMAIFWTSLQFIMSNFDIVNCIIRSAGILFISQLDEYQFKLLKRLPQLKEDIDKFSLLREIQFTVKIGMAQYIIEGVLQIILLQFFVCPLQFFIKRLVMFNTQIEIPNIQIDKLSRPEAENNNTNN